jgi:hypothetical protein
MTIVYHPNFPKDIRRFAADYKEISDGLAARFRKEVEEGIDAIKGRPRPPVTSCKQDPRWFLNFGGATFELFRFSSSMV